MVKGNLCFRCSNGVSIDKELLCSARNRKKRMWCKKQESKSSKEKMRKETQRKKVLYKIRVR